MHPIHLILNATPYEEFDYGLLMSALSSYSAPRDVVTRLLNEKAIIRVKKGIYTIGPLYQRRLISLEVLANMIYGPSYISNEYALQHHGLIPEGVVEVTSMTCKRKKIYDTPLGRFSYKPINISAYAAGIYWHSLPTGQLCLMATPEKAIADLLVSKKYSTESGNELLAILVENYRIEEEYLINLDLKNMIIIAKYYKKKIIFNLLACIGQLK